MTQKVEAFGGKHLIMDGYGCDYRALSDVEIIRAFLDDLPEQIGMRKIGPAVAFPWRDCPDPDDWGVTGFVLITTSHITIHTFPQRQFLYTDAFSCKDFNEKRVIQALIDTFGIDRFESHVFDRGSEFGLQPRASVPGRVFRCGGQ